MSLFAGPPPPLPMMVYKVSPSPQPCNRHTASPGKVAPTVFIRLNRLITISKLFFRIHCSYCDAAPTVPLFTLPILYQRNIHNLEVIVMIKEISKVVFKRSSKKELRCVFSRSIGSLNYDLCSMLARSFIEFTV